MLGVVEVANVRMWMWTFWRWRWRWVCFCFFVVVVVCVEWEPCCLVYEFASVLSGCSVVSKGFVVDICTIVTMREVFWAAVRKQRCTTARRFALGPAANCGAPVES